MNKLEITKQQFYNAGFNVVPFHENSNAAMIDYGYMNGAKNQNRILEMKNFLSDNVNKC